jgi:hypothetical protein
VSSDDDDEALTWVGGRDPSHYETPEAKPVKSARAGATPKSNVEAADDDPGDDEAPVPTSGAVLVMLGLLGGIYLLYTVGWFISWRREVYVDPNTLELAAFRLQQVLAIVAAPLWFAATIFFTRNRTPVLRLIWLVIGALLLVPWPFTFGR